MNVILREVRDVLQKDLSSGHGVSLLHDARALHGRRPTTPRHVELAEAATRTGFPSTAPPRRLPLDGSPSTARVPHLYHVVYRRLLRHTLQQRKMLKLPLKLFIAYARADREYLRALVRHLAPLCRERLIQVWHDGDIEPGEEWGQLIGNQLDSAQVIVALVSASFISSYECYDVELARALKRHDANDVILIPTIVRHCAWGNLPFARIQVLPTDATPVRAWVDEDEAWTDVVNGINRVVRRMCNEVAAEKVNTHRALPEHPPNSSGVDLTGDDSTAHFQIPLAATGKENAVPRIANDTVAVRETLIQNSDDSFSEIGQRLESSKHSSSTDRALGQRSTFPDGAGAWNNEAPPPRQPDRGCDVSIRAASPTVYDKPALSAIAVGATSAHPRSTPTAPSRMEDELIRRRGITATNTVPVSQEPSKLGAFVLSALKLFLGTLLGSGASGAGACAINLFGDKLRAAFNTNIFGFGSQPRIPGAFFMENVALVGVPLIAIFICYISVTDEHFAPKGIVEWLGMLMVGLLHGAIFSVPGTMVVCAMGLGPFMVFEYLFPAHQFVRSLSSNSLAMLCGATLGLWSVGLWSLTELYRLHRERNRLHRNRE